MVTFTFNFKFTLPLWNPYGWHNIGWLTFIACICRDKNWVCYLPRTKHCAVLLSQVRRNSDMSSCTLRNSVAVTSSNLPYIRYMYIPFSDGCSYERLDYYEVFWPKPELEPVSDVSFPATAQTKVGYFIIIHLEQDQASDLNRSSFQKIMKILHFNAAVQTGTLHTKLKSRPKLFGKSELENT